MNNILISIVLSFLTVCSCYPLEYLLAQKIAQKGCPESLKRDFKLIQACSKGDVKKVKVLVKAGANANMVDILNGRAISLLLAATQHGHSNVISTLLSYGADPNRITEFSALVGASAGGHFACVDLLLRAGARVNQIGYQKATALMVAAREGHHKIVTLLMEYGADSSLVDFYNMNALQHACKKSKRKCVKALLDGGADINSLDYQGMSVLIKAARSGKQPKLISLLIEYGANIYIKDGYGRTALDYARRREHSARRKMKWAGMCYMTRPLQPIISAAEKEILAKKIQKKTCSRKLLEHADGILKQQPYIALFDLCAIEYADALTNDENKPFLPNNVLEKLTNSHLKDIRLRVNHIRRNGQPLLEAGSYKEKEKLETVLVEKSALGFPAHD